VKLPLGTLGSVGAVAYPNTGLAGGGPVRRIGCLSRRGNWSRGSQRNERSTKVLPFGQGYEALDYSGAADHEPGARSGAGGPHPGLLPEGEGERCAAGFGGLSQALAGTSRDGSEGRGSGMSPRAGRDSLSLRERVGVREPGSTLAMACMGRFMERNVFQNWTRIGTMNRGARSGAGGPHPGLLLRERAGVREPGSTLAMACMGRFMGSVHHQETFHPDSNVFPHLLTNP
jgi:hypothetical protein